MHYAATGLHLLLVSAAWLGMVEIPVPFWSALSLCIMMFLRDRTIFFVYPGMILMTLGFLSPLLLANAPIALKIPPNGSEYDHEMILSLYIFVGIFSVYTTSANTIRARNLAEVRIGKTDFVPYLSCVMLLFFSALMIKDGTLLAGDYRSITAERHGFIEYASLLTLAGYCAARSKLARNCLLACALVYLATTFLVGLRLRFISVGIVVFCCVIGVKIHQGWKLWGLLAAMVLFILGLARGGSGFSGFNLGDALSIETLYIKGALVSTAGGAFQTSKFLAYYVEYVTPQAGISGIHLFLGDILSVFLTRGGVPDAFRSKAQLTNYFDVPGGGLLPGYFYAYLGLGGAIILSIIFTMLVVYILRRRDAHVFPYQVILAAYAPRVLLYDWTVGFKMVFYFFVIKSALSLLAKSSKTFPTPHAENRSDS